MATAYRTHSAWSRFQAYRADAPSRSRVRHRAADALAVMVFSAALSGVLALVLTGLTWWATRSGEISQ